MLLDKLERGVRALERIADALERYNRAVMFNDYKASGNVATFDGQISEHVEVHIGGEVTAWKGEI